MSNKSSHLFSQILFIGLGNMGGPMAKNLLRGIQQSSKFKNFQLWVSDLDEKKMKPLVRLGAKSILVDKLAEKVSDMNFIFTSLPGPLQVQNLILKKNSPTDFLKNLQTRSGTIWVELSTNNLEVAKKIRETGGDKIVLLDAPVSGGIEGAKAGTLMIMIGGDKSAFNRVKPLLKFMGKEILYLGASGAGYVAKIAQVMLCYLHSIALSEALMLGVKGGVEAKTMLSIIQNSTGKSYVADRYGPPLLKGSYDPGFTLGLAHKDMKLTLELAKFLKTVLPMCRLVEKQYRQAKEKYGGMENHLMAVKILEEMNSQYLRTKK